MPSIFTPVEPTPAVRVGSVAEALGLVGPGRPVALEAHLDGVPFQAHRSGDEVRIWLAALTEVTDELGEVVDAVRAIEADPLIVEGVATGEAGSRVPFFVDALLVDGTSLVGLPLVERIALLGECTPVQSMVQRTTTAFPAVAEAFAAHVREQGGTGVEVRDVAAPRGAAGDAPTRFLVA